VASIFLLAVINVLINPTEAKKLFYNIQKLDHTKAPIETTIFKIIGKKVSNLIRIEAIRIGNIQYPSKHILWKIDL
jgi:hypothetical protein